MEETEFLAVCYFVLAGLPGIKEVGADLPLLSRQVNLAVSMGEEKRVTCKNVLIFSEAGATVAHSVVICTMILRKMMDQSIGGASNKKCSFHPVQRIIILMKVTRICH